MEFSSRLKFPIAIRLRLIMRKAWLPGDIKNLTFIYNYSSVPNTSAGTFINFEEKFPPA